MLTATLLWLGFAFAQGGYVEPLSKLRNEAARNYRQALLHRTSIDGYSCFAGIRDYEELVRRTHRRQDRKRLADFYFQTGRYSLAVAELHMAGLGEISSAREAARRSLIAQQLQLKLGASRVLQIEPLGAQGRWVALVGDSDQSGKEMKWMAETFVQARLIRFTFQSPHLMIEGSRLALPDEDPDFPRAPTMYIVSPSWHMAEPWIAVLRPGPGADNSPCRIDLVSTAGRAMRIRGSFNDKGGSAVIPETRHHGLIVQATPTFKVWWTDTYEWKNGRFVFANSRHPELYTHIVKPPKGDYDYHWSWMYDAATLDCQRHFKKALRFWRHAAKQLALAIKFPDRQNSHDGGYPGDQGENLKEIRQRIRWLEARDYNHPLLYRPYDFDLQVPPYRLGSAHNRGS